MSDRTTALLVAVATLLLDAAAVALAWRLVVEGR